MDPKAFSRNLVHKGGAAAIVGRHIVVLRDLAVAGGKGQTTIEREVRVQLESTDNFIHPSRHAGADHLILAEGQIVVAGENPGMPPVVVAVATSDGRVNEELIGLMIDSVRPGVMREEL